jgi:hypothetical protein
LSQEKTILPKSESINFAETLCQILHEYIRLKSQEVAAAKRLAVKLIAMVATMKNPTAEKIHALQHAIEVNNSEMRFIDPVCLYRNCLHHYSQHGRTWKTNGRRKSCLNT